MNVEPKRYFLNHYPDFDDGGPSSITITPEKQKEMLDMLVNIVLKNFTKDSKVCISDFFPLLKLIL